MTSFIKIEKINIKNLTVSSICVLHVFSVISNIMIIHIYIYLQMAQVGLTENIKGDKKKFELWLRGREEVYIIQVKL